MLNIMLCGCQGKMGRVIEECTRTRTDCRIAAGIDLDTSDPRDFPVYASPADCKEDVDVIVDFSHPNSLDGLLEYAPARKTPLVIATTGYSEAQIARIHEAAKYIPLDRLCLSPQCGFASCEIGNKLTEAQQWAKLSLVKEIAEEVWG